MIVNPKKLPSGYEPPALWHVWHSSCAYTTYPVVTVECEDFDEFRHMSLAHKQVMSHQSGLGPWFLSFIFGGFCGGCDYFIAYTDAGHYLCERCRS